MVASLSSFFGAIALLLACIGLYGVMAYTVSRRTNEIGIRMALGAQRIQVLWMVLRNVLSMAIFGIVVGIIVSSVATRLFRTQLYGLSPNDPVTILAAASVLMTVAMLAGYLPARRAASVDPVIALRYE